MKTCSFDDAESQSASQTLFYEQGEPEARYKLVPCGIRTCPCCNSTDESMTNQSWKAIDFDGSSMHRFLNGYTTYLNCSAVSVRSNYLYLSVTIHKSILDMWHTQYYLCHDMSMWKV